jgi:hypothetical protein
MEVQKRSKAHVVKNQHVIAQAPRKPAKNTSLDQPTPSLNYGPKFQAQETTKLEYNMVEYLRKLKSNISMMDLCRIPQKKFLLLQALDEDDKVMIESYVIFRGVKRPDLNIVSADKKPHSLVPPFLLTFEIYRRNLHNCLVDSSASSNVMPLSMCKKINATPTKI